MKAAKAVRYRFGQFLRALRAPREVSGERVARATAILTPRMRTLFARQAPQDQCHALAVYERLLRRGYTNADLLRAALLHDVGKVAARASPLQRGIFVLIEPLAGDALTGARGEAPEGALAPFFAYANHAEVGARWAEEAGCSELTVALIRHHEETPTSSEADPDRLLMALQEADGAS